MYGSHYELKRVIIGINLLCFIIEYKYIIFDKLLCNKGKLYIPFVLMGCSCVRQLIPIKLPAIYFFENSPIIHKFLILKPVL